MVESSFELGECAEHMQHEAAGGACGVDLFGQRAHVAGAKILDEAQQMRQGPAEPIQACHHYGVPRCRVGQQFA